MQVQPIWIFIVLVVFPGISGAIWAGLENIRIIEDHIQDRRAGRIADTHPSSEGGKKAKDRLITAFTKGFAACLAMIVVIAFLLRVLS